MTALISTGQAGRVLDLSRERVLDFIRDGRLRVAATDNFGRRLLRSSDVERLAEERRARQQTTAGGR